MRDRFYSTADLARVCGVSISTIKRWTDAGVLRCVRTPGGHRKFRVQDVAQAAERLGLTLADAEARPAAQLDTWALALLHGNRLALRSHLVDLLGRGDAAAVPRFLLDLHRHGLGLVECAELLGAAVAAAHEAAAGDRFAARRAEQAAVAAARHVVSQMPAPAADAPGALLVTAPGSDASLAVALAQIALGERGWRTFDLGLETSPDVVRAGLAAERARLVLAFGVAALPEIERACAAAGVPCRRAGEGAAGELVLALGETAPAAAAVI